MKPFALLALAAALAGCAPAVQHAFVPAPSFTGPRLEDSAFISFDGARLGLTHWDVPGGHPWAVIVGVHGLDDYANAFHLAAPYWARHGIATYAYDQRGFGRSPHRGLWAGDALFTQDLRTITALVRARYPHAVIAVAGESLGGAVAIEAFASRRPPDADRLILLAPAVWGWSSQPLAYKVALWITAHVARSAVLTPPSFVTDHIQASDNRAELIAMGKDPLMLWGARTDALFGLVTTMQHAWSQIGLVRVPTIYMLGAHDEIIPRKPALQAARRLPAGDRSAYYAHGWHLLLRDLHARLVWADVAAFIRDPDGPLPSGAPVIPGAHTMANELPARREAARDDRAVGGEVSLARKGRP
ncbi:MAG TPA: alpha/beta fold hydrolase [Caulobacteraceae bacterium]|nr:alpha/beta fold hydrolase [Caulobacteraceae bacterium]